MADKNISKDEYLKLLKCIRCGSFEDLQLYKHAQKLATGFKKGYKSSTTEYTVWTQEFPVCNNCYEKFEIWKKTRKKYHGIFCLIFIAFWIILMIFVTELIFGSDSIDNINIFATILQSYIIYIIFPVIIIIIVIIVGNYSYKHKITNDNPDYYMGTTYGRSSIKPENSEKWISFAIWAELALNERIRQGKIDPTLMTKLLETIPRKPSEAGIEKEKIIDKNIKNCPKCGNLVNLSKSQICEVCGFEFK